MKARFMRVAVPVLLLSCGAIAAPINLITNGGFETNGGAGTEIFAGWTVTDEPGSFNPSGFYVQTGTASPLDGFPVPPPPQGSFAAMTDQAGAGSHVLRQTFTVPGPGTVTLSFNYFRFNQAGAYFSPNSLDFATNPNQQARVDILTAGAGAFDLGAAVVQNVLRTMPGDPVHDAAYQTLSMDLTPFIGAGGTFQLRFAEVDNQLFFNFGVDNVQLLYTAAAVPEPGTWSLIGVGLLAVAAIRFRRAAA